MRNKIILVLCIAALIISFFGLGLDQHFSLEAMKAKQASFTDFYHANKFLTILAFASTYIIMTGAMIPGAALLTLLAGALFGAITGTIIVSFASTIGATIAMLFSRYLFREMVEKKYQAQAQKINDGIAREGGFYLFGLRLIPIFPFFVINALFGLTQMSWQKFFLISQAGMLPGTFVFVFAGTQLAQLESLSGILSPNIILAFTLLAIFPYAAKHFMSWLKKTRGKAK